MTQKPFDRLEDRPSLNLSRREFIGFVGATLAASACGGSFEQEQAPEAPLLVADPFRLGVASGDPVSDGAILWTRLAPEPIDGGGMGEEPVPVIWEVSRREDFRSVETFGWAWAEPAWGHSVHVEVSGLEADTWYYYRFRVGRDWVSQTGRTRIFPRPEDSPERLRMATASCQNYRHGYYTAHRHLAGEDVDLVAFLGDYIYESGVAGSVRDHEGPRPQTLEAFRNRYARYKTDADLQAAHAAFPWMLTWDDHEVLNNYADLEIPRVDSVEEAKALRAAAYQAYYEHMPLRIPQPDQSHEMQIYRSARFGDLVTFFVLDGRQYRSDQPCDGNAGLACDEIYDDDRTMLGEAQRDWLTGGLRASETTWNAIVQQTVFASLNLGGGVVNPDQWDGYAVERQRLLSVFAEEGVQNVVVHTGDIHAAVFATLHRKANYFDTEIVGVEFVTTSISSNGLSNSNYPADFIKDAMRRQKNVGFFDPDMRGYCVCEYTPDKLTVEYRTVSTVEQREAQLETAATIEVAAGSLDIT